MIKKLLQVLTRCIFLLDEDEMNIPQTIQCKTCKNFTAKLQSYSGTFAMYCCSLCKTTSGGSVEKGYEAMGKKKKKNKNKNKGKKNMHVNTISKTTTVNDSWEVEIECVEECSKVPDKVVIWVHPLAKRKIDALMKEYKSIEWLAYLIGKKEEKEVFDIFIPEQDISAASVDNIQCEEWNDILPIGVIHSHHTMGHNFSHTDHTWINQNHDISLVISDSGMDGQCRIKTACGAYKVVKVDVKLKVNIDFNDKEFIESVKDKINKKTYTTTYYGYGEGYQTWDSHNGWVKPGNQYNTAQGTKPVIEEEEITTFLTETELEDIDKEIDELDFERELSLAEELDLLEETSNLDDKEAN